MRSRKGDAEKVPYWQRMMREAARSEMSIGESCRRRRLRESQFYWGRRHLKPGWQQRTLCRPGVPEGAASFALTSEEAGASEAGIKLGLGDGRRLRIRRGVHEEILRAVFAALESSPCCVSRRRSRCTCARRRVISLTRDRSFDGLSMMAERLIQCNPFSGHLLVFCSRRSDRVKVLYLDHDGWALCHPSADGLEARTFQLPFAETGRKEIAAWELAVLLEGIDLSRGRWRKRYSLPAARHEEEGEKTERETRVS